MKIVYNFSEKDFISVCRQNTTRQNTTIFNDIYDALKFFINQPSHLKIFDIIHNYKFDYYDDSLSIHDYIKQGHINFPYLKFDLSFSLDNETTIDDIIFPEFIHLNELQYGFGKKLKFKIKKTLLKTKQKFSITLLNISISQRILRKLYIQSSAVGIKLAPSTLGAWEWRQTFYNKVNGKSYFCSCFKNAITASEDTSYQVHPHIKYALDNNSYKEGICHLCTGDNSDLSYCHKMYGSAFKVKYGAYIRKFEIERNIDSTQAENIVRDIKRVPRIGEQWINETILFNYVDSIFSEYRVEREASPTWLGRQRFDVYIPELKLAIEYQGEQHYKEVSLFGGKEGLSRTKTRDNEKLNKSRTNGVQIIYFKYNEDLSESLIREKLKHYLN